MKHIYILFLSLLSANLKADDFDKLLATYRIQNEYYTQKNKCGEENFFSHKVIIINRKITPTQYNKINTIHTIEDNTKREQTLFFNKTNYYFPTLFSVNGHTEYDAPICKKEQKICDFYYPLITTEWGNISDKGIYIGKMLDKNQVAVDYFYFETNVNRALNYEEIPKYELFWDEKNTVKFIFKNSDIKKIKAPFIDFVVQYKTEPKEEYKEEKKRISNDFNQNELILNIPNTKKPIIYLGGYIYFELNGISYENKIEIHNTEREFYKCTNK